MRPTTKQALAFSSLLLLGTATSAALAGEDPATYSWRYFRPGNTGVQGDINEAVWVSPTGDPYVGGYSPGFEEGGFAQYLVNEDRWVNYSNVDYAVMGHPEEQGKIRITDIVPDASGRLWMGAWWGALSFDPAVGPSSLTRYAPGNSQIRNGMTSDIDRAPDGSLWFANEGMVRFDPGTGTWSRWSFGHRFCSVQPKPGGGYLVWSSNFPEFNEGVSFYDTATGSWTFQGPTGAPGQIVAMPGKDCVDDTGNFWAIRSQAPGDWPSLDYRKMDGTWVTPPEPYAAMAFSAWAFKAYGDRKALFVDGNSTVWQFDGTSWHDLGMWHPGAYTYAVDIDEVGDIWVTGVGGVARRDAATGTWQRFRITNTGNCDNFNGDLALDPFTGDVYTTANAGAGIGGMTRFDGERWVSWNVATYGLGYDWPFLTDNCHALTVRASNGNVVVSPSDWIYGIHEWDGTSFTQIPGVDGANRLLEDGLGRLWALGGTTTLSYHDGIGWVTVPGIGGGTELEADPDTPGGVWAANQFELLRTDGTTSFRRGIEDFPGSAQTFTGLAAEPGGVVWIGTWTQFTIAGSTLLRLDADTGTYQTWRYNTGWPFPGQHVRPLTVTPDGRLWMLYDSEYPSPDAGLCWFDGENVGSFPAPPGGIPQWGGMPHAGLNDIEVRTIPNGYELWMTFGSRSVAALSVVFTDPAEVEEPGPIVASGGPVLGPSVPNPWTQETRLGFALPRSGSVRLEVFDAAGRRMRRLVDSMEEAGQHEVIWDGRDDRGLAVPAGIYYARLEAGGVVGEEKLVRIR